MKAIALILSISLSLSLQAQTVLNPDWVKTEIIPNGNAQAWGITVDNNDDVYWAVTAQYIPNNLDTKCYKYDTDGNDLWNDPFYYGGSGTQQAYVATVNDTSLFLGGKTCGPTFLDCDMLLLSIDRNSGELEWDESFNFAGDGYDEIDAIEFQDGSIYCGGWGQEFQGSPYQQEMGLWKLDRDGNTEWTNYFGQENSAEHIDGHFVVDENYIFAAGLWNGTGGANLYNGHAFLGKFSKTDGSMVDSTLFGTQSNAFLDIENALGMASDGTYLYITGYATPVAANDWQIFIAKYDKNLNQIWYKDWGAEGTETARGITIANNKIYIAGLTESSSLITGGDRDGLLLTLDLDGNVIEYFTWGDDAMNSFHDLAVQGSKIYLTGESVANNQESGFLLAFTDMAVSTFEPEVQIDIQVYPNPSQGNIIIEGNENLLGAELNIFDQLGRFVSKETIQSERMETYLNQGGIYYVNIQSEDFMLTRKVVVVK